MSAAESTAEKRRLSILLADDNPDIIVTLATLLAHEGHIVHTVYRGDGVLDAARRYKADVCILDINMPGRNGYDLVRDITNEFGAQRPALIAISGQWVRKSDELLALTIGFDRFFVKPADPVELLRFLDDLAGSGNKRP